MKWGCMHWVELAQDSDEWKARVNTAMHIRVPYNIGNLFRSSVTGGFSRRFQLHGVRFACLSQTNQLNTLSIPEVPAKETTPVGASAGH
jgi:hypothetical protein